MSIPESMQIRDSSPIVSNVHRRIYLFPHLCIPLAGSVDDSGYTFLRRGVSSFNLEDLMASGLAGQLVS
jgi:hypothetical protein